MLTITLTIIIVLGSGKQPEMKENWYEKYMYYIFGACLLSGLIDITMYLKFFQIISRL